MDKFDWKNARRFLPFRGTAARPGSKLTARCPHCNSVTYGYHGGRFKRCMACGYDRREEKHFDIVQGLMVRRRSAELSDRARDRAATYWALIYGPTPSIQPAETEPKP